MSDNGEGIDPAFVPYVFDRFRQADASTTRRHGGPGLALAIVKQLVELHGGRVSARSEVPGTGSTFTVALPTAAARASSDAGGGRTTARPHAEDRAKAIRAGFQVHVPKPVEPAELLRTIDTLLGRGVRAPA